MGIIKNSKRRVGNIIFNLTKESKDGTTESKKFLTNSHHNIYPLLSDTDPDELVEVSNE